MFDLFFAFVDRCVMRIEQLRSPVSLFAALGALLMLQLWPSEWTGNEENYFQLGYRTFAPEKFSQFHAVFDASIARFVPFYLLGSAVHLFGYEGAHAITRVLMALLYAAGLAYFFSALRLSVWDALLVIVAFMLAGEHLIGREWLFQGVEAKTLAYGLMFFGFGFALRGRWTAATIAGAAATYMHVLVGGFWTMMLLVQQWWETKQRRDVLRLFAVYGLLILPLAWMIARDELAGAAIPGAAPVAEIYASRAAHHVAPFAGRRAFWEWTPGIVATLALLLAVGALGRHRAATRPVAVVSRTALIGLAYLLLALAAAFADRHTQLLGKLILFRPSSLTLLLTLTAITALLSERLGDRGAALKSLVIFALVASFSWRTFKTQVDKSRAAATAMPERGELVAAIISHTAPGDVVLIEPDRELEAAPLSLHRQIPRPTLVSWKFVPTHPADILRWHGFIKLRKDVFAKGCGAAMPVPVRWLVTLRRESVGNVASCGTPVWQKGEFALVPVPIR